MVHPRSRRRPLLVAMFGSLCLLAGFAVPGSAAVSGANSSLGVTIAAYEGDSVGSASTGIIDAGSDVTYEVTATSPGKTRQTNVDVSVGLPSNFVFDVASTPSAGTVTSGGGTLSWSIPKLPKGASATLDYTETTDTPDVGMEADGTTVSAGSDQSSAPTINSSVEVLPEANVSIGVSDGMQSVSPGQTDTYTISLANAGPSEVPNATVTSTLSGGFALAYATSSVSGTTFTNLGGDQFQWSAVDLPAGVSATLTLVGQISSTLGSGAAMVNVATVTLTPPEIDTSAISQAVDAEPVIGTASGSGSGPGFALSIAAHAGDSIGTVPTEEVEAGSDVTYQVELANVLPGPQTNLTVPIQLPPNFSLYPNSVTPSVGTTSQSGSVIDWTIPTLPTGASATLVYSEQSDTPGAMEADWTSVAATSDQSTTASTAMAAVEVIPATDLSVQIGDAAHSVNPGQGDVYTVTLTNGGPSDANNVTVTDSLNGGFSVQSVSSSVGGTAVLKLAPEQVQWTGLTIPAGTSATLTITGTVLPGLSVGSVLVDIAAASPNPAEIDTDAGSVSLDWDTVVPAK
jgi:uncharacterized repeat protein (TIGR01451 family)